MNFKEALIAHLQGEKVEVLWSGEWVSFVEKLGHAKISEFSANTEYGTALAYRLTPRTITVNGVEVPAPESETIADGRLYFIASPHVDAWSFAASWSSSNADKQWLERGLIYLNKEDAIARAKAMLLYK